MPNTQQRVDRLVSQVCLRQNYCDTDEPGLIKVYHPDDLAHEQKYFSVNYGPNDLTTEAGVRRIVRDLQHSVDGHQLPTNLYAALSRWSAIPGSVVYSLPKHGEAPPAWVIQCRPDKWIVVALETGPGQCQLETPESLTILTAAAIMYRRIDVLAILETLTSPVTEICAASLDLSFQETAHNFDSKPRGTTVTKVAQLFNKQLRVQAGALGKEQRLGILFEVLTKVLRLQWMEIYEIPSNNLDEPPRRFAAVTIQNMNNEPLLIEFEDLDFSDRPSLLFFIYRLRAGVTHTVDKHLTALGRKV